MQRVKTKLQCRISSRTWGLATDIFAEMKDVLMNTVIIEKGFLHYMQVMNINYELICCVGHETTVLYTI